MTSFLYIQASRHQHYDSSLLFQDLLNCAIAISCLEVIISSDVPLMNEDVWNSTLASLFEEARLNVSALGQLVELENLQGLIFRNFCCEAFSFLAVGAPGL